MLFRSSSEPTPLTVMSPIRRGYLGDQSYTSITREYLQSLEGEAISPMARVPNTFLCRFYILHDVFFEGTPAVEDHLRSQYLVFCCNFHGRVEDYLRGFWTEAQDHAQSTWRFCVGFEQVQDEATFIEYIKRCALKTTFYFNGSSGAPLAEQLKALYLKQELSQFACDAQGLAPAQLRAAFRAFIARTQPANLDGPSWFPGQNSL